MNDFTKEELQIILEGLLWRDGAILPIHRPEKLKGKLQSMIDNYCEHKNTDDCKCCNSIVCLDCENADE